MAAKPKNNIGSKVNKPNVVKHKHETEHDKKYGKADFSEEYNGKLAKILVLNQPLFIGKIIDVRPYWIKFENSDGKTIYINKAYILTIELIGVKP
jgi:hypothetical protein